MKRWRPLSLTSQLMLAIALALLLGQTVSAALIYRAQAERREMALVHAAAFRLLLESRQKGPPPHPRRHRAPPAFEEPRSLRVEKSEVSPLRIGEDRDTDAEAALRQILSEQDLLVGDVIVTRRPIAKDKVAFARLLRRSTVLGHVDGPRPGKVLIAAVQPPGRQSWLVVRVIVPPGERAVVLTLIGQALFIYALIVGALALILRRITRPLAALTRRLERLADTREAGLPLEPEGPEDVRRLIVAHNAMEARITALLEEKDVMLGAIGHDLKTPLAALRVRIESVENETERQRMAATIEDIVRTLDDILSLARVGRPRDPREPTELSALVASVVEEFEDMGEAVELEDTVRIVVSLRTTWLRRALRNLVSNGLRYGRVARVSVRRDGGLAVVRICDEGPGIAEADIARMQEPFTRGEPSRNSVTGGAGLGLALARAIAEQHGGTLHLANRRDAAGAITGLNAELRLPIG